LNSCVAGNAELVREIQTVLQAHVGPETH
jgi:hypothetical protein